MGLGPLGAVYQARFNRYLQNRGIKDTSQQRVWAFLGDGEMDEPESLAGISLAAREGLDNLTFVINCNLQRLDGPVRGNGKIIQELEGAVPRRRLERDQGRLGPRVGRAARARRRRRAGREDERDASTASSRRFASPAAPTSASTSSGPTRGCAGSSSTCPTTTCSSSAAAATTTARSTPPTRPRPSSRARRRSILAKTVKGWTLGPGVEARNITHQAKKLTEDELRVFRDRLELPIPDAKLKDAPYFHPGPDSEEVQYMPGAAHGSWAGRSRAASCAPQPLPPAGAGRRRGVRRRAARPRSRRRWSSPGILRNLIRDPQHRQAHRADHPGRGAHVRHGPAVQGGRHLRRQRAALRAGRLRARALVPRGDRTARCSRRASPRRARWPRSSRPGRRTRRTASR